MAGFLALSRNYWSAPPQTKLTLKTTLIGGTDLADI
jgi:hypothetical protein